MGSSTPNSLSVSWYIDTKSSLNIAYPNGKSNLTSHFLKISSFIFYLIINSLRSYVKDI